MNKKIYGSARGGVEAMKILKQTDYESEIDFDFLSTHPSLNKRIKYLEAMK